MTYCAGTSLPKYSFRSSPEQPRGRGLEHRTAKQQSGSFPANSNQPFPSSTSRSSAAEAGNPKPMVESELKSYGPARSDCCSTSSSTMVPADWGPRERLGDSFSWMVGRREEDAKVPDIVLDESGGGLKSGLIGRYKIAVRRSSLETVWSLWRTSAIDCEERDVSQAHVSTNDVE